MPSNAQRPPYFSASRPFYIASALEIAQNGLANLMSPFCSFYQPRRRRESNPRWGFCRRSSPQTSLNRLNHRRDSPNRQRVSRPPLTNPSFTFLVFVTPSDDFTNICSAVKRMRVCWTFSRLWPTCGIPQECRLNAWILSR